MRNRTIVKILFDACIIVLLGILVGFSFNYARKDGLSLKQSKAGVERGDSAATQKNDGKPVEPVQIKLEEAKRYFEEGSTLFVDAREKEEYTEGHIKGSINIPYGWYINDHPDISSLIDGKKTIVTYCSGTECEASIELAYAMYERGFGGVKIFFGGWQEWVNANLPIEKGD